MLFNILLVIICFLLFVVSSFEMGWSFGKRHMTTGIFSATCYIAVMYGMVSEIPTDHGNPWITWGVMLAIVSTWYSMFSLGKRARELDDLKLVKSAENDILDAVDVLNCTSYEPSGMEMVEAISKYSTRRAAIDVLKSGDIRKMSPSKISAEVKELVKSRGYILER